jgi:hypothetical protein
MGVPQICDDPPVALREEVDELALSRGELLSPPLALQPQFVKRQH